MRSPVGAPAKFGKTEVMIALIGVAGVIVTALFSNWDKLFPVDNVVQATYSGYQPTGHFETELRYYFEVSGTRASLEAMTEQTLQHLRIQWLLEDPADAKLIDAIANIAKEEALTFDQVVKELLPVYRAHFTVEEIQELNRFYSTEVMQTMVRKMPLVTIDAAPLQVELLQDLERRIWNRIERLY